MNELDERIFQLILEKPHLAGNPDAIRIALDLPPDKEMPARFWSTSRNRQNLERERTDTHEATTQATILEKDH